MWQLSGPVPFCVQKLAYESFAQADGVISRPVVIRSVETLVRHQASDFAKTIEQLSPGQRRVLKFLAAGTTMSRGSSEFASSVGLANATSVRKTIRALEDDELVVGRENGPAVNDPFFAAWLRLPGGNYD